MNYISQDDIAASNEGHTGSPHPTPFKMKHTQTFTAYSPKITQTHKLWEQISEYANIFLLKAHFVNEQKQP